MLQCPIEDICSATSGCCMQAFLISCRGVPRAFAIELLVCIYLLHNGPGSCYEICSAVQCINLRRDVGSNTFLFLLVRVSLYELEDGQSGLGVLVSHRRISCLSRFSQPRGPHDCSCQTREPKTKMASTENEGRPPLVSTSQPLLSRDIPGSLDCFNV